MGAFQWACVSTFGLALKQKMRKNKTQREGKTAVMEADFYCV